MIAVFKNNDGNECRCNADDAMMKCNKQINTHDDNEKQGRRLERRSWGVTTLHHYRRISSRDLRTAPEKSGRGREEVKLSCFFDKRVKPRTLRD